METLPADSKTFLVVSSAVEAGRADRANMPRQGALIFQEGRGFNICKKLSLVRKKRFITTVVTIVKNARGVLVQNLERIQRLVLNAAGSVINVERNTISFGRR